MNDEKQNDKRSLPIQIFVSYPWPKEEDGKSRGRKDNRWNELRSLLEAVKKEVEKRAAQRKPGNRKLDIRVNRLRGLHGQILLTMLNERIDRCDILIADIGNLGCSFFNSNVLLELGMAIGLGKLESRGVYVFKPKNLPSPSDISGVITTDYTLKSETLKLEDKRGFTAALRTRLLELAEQRGMIEPR
jgi:hypothetical protein